jgi:hypothetical protein
MAETTQVGPAWRFRAGRGAGAAVVLLMMDMKMPGMKAIR